MQTSQMEGTKVQQSGLGGGGASLLAALLMWLSLLPLRAQYTAPRERTQHTQTPSSIRTSETTPSLSQICGRTRFYGKIFGGQSAMPERWPWQASLRFWGQHICGAVLIDKYWVAGAAHCFQKSHNPSDYQIWLGYNQLSNPTKYSRQMRVYKLIVHRDYDKFHPQGSDIALMQLRTPVEYSSHILPACVPDNNTRLNYVRPCWISGWGMITEQSFLPKPMQLQEAEVIVIENQHCEFYFPPSFPGSRDYSIHDDVICAGDFYRGKSICRGDSGGPLVCLVNAAWYVVGLSSWSIPCEEPITSPSVFARVSYFADWIRNNKKNSPDPTTDPTGQSPDKKPRPPFADNWYHRNGGTVIKPTPFMALLSSQIFLLQWVGLWSP